MQRAKKYKEEGGGATGGALKVENPISDYLKEKDGDQLLTSFETFKCFLREKNTTSTSMNPHAECSRG